MEYVVVKQFKCFAKMKKKNKNKTKKEELIVMRSTQELQLN